MASDPFRPFEEHLDRDAALRHLREAVAGADDGELFLERRHRIDRIGSTAARDLEIADGEGRVIGDG